MLVEPFKGYFFDMLQDEVFYKSISEVEFIQYTVQLIYLCTQLHISGLFGILPKAYNLFYLVKNDKLKLPFI